MPGHTRPCPHQTNTGTCTVSNVLPSRHPPVNGSKRGKGECSHHVYQSVSMVGGGRSLGPGFPMSGAAGNAAGCVITAANTKQEAGYKPITQRRNCLAVLLGCLDCWAVSSERTRGERPGLLIPNKTSRGVRWPSWLAQADGGQLVRHLGGFDREPRAGAGQLGMSLFGSKAGRHAQLAVPLGRYLCKQTTRISG